MEEGGVETNEEALIKLDFYRDKFKSLIVQSPSGLCSESVQPIRNMIKTPHGVTYNEPSVQFKLGGNSFYDNASRRTMKRSELLSR
jgi:hypothetical protein